MTDQERETIVREEGMENLNRVELCLSEALAELDLLQSLCREVDDCRMYNKAETMKADIRALCDACKKNIELFAPEEFES